MIRLTVDEALQVDAALKEATTTLKQLHRRTGHYGNQILELTKGIDNALASLGNSDIASAQRILCEVKARVYGNIAIEAASTSTASQIKKDRK